MRQGTAVVDTHFHVWEPERRGRPRLRGPSAPPRQPDPHPVEAMIPVLDAAGVDVGVQVTPSLIGFDNRYSLEAAAANPDRIVVIGLFNLLLPNPAARLRRWMANRHARGIRLMFFESPLEADADSRLLDPFWNAAEELAVPVGVYAPGSLACVLYVLQRHPSLQLHLDHLCLDFSLGPADPYRNVGLYERFARFPGVTMKISGLPSLSKEPFPFADTHRVVERALAAFGAERLMWGSNYPTLFDGYSYEQSVSYLDHCRFVSPADREHVLGRTAARVFRLSPTSLVSGTSG